jgi:murein DD-endopeptidase MepM/ murein hydrolase activator NlpD
MRAEIDRTQSKIDGKQAHAQVLASTISHLSGRINGIQGGITKLRARQAGVQARLDGAIARLRLIQTEHQAAEQRLAKLKERLVLSRRVLARRLLNLYQSDRPDLITVVLHSDGFARLIENREYLSRIGGQDRQIITTVKQNKDETTVLSKRLAATEAARQAVAAQIQASRDEISAVRGALESKQQAWIDARSARQAALSTVRQQSRKLKEHQDALQADIDSITGELRSSTPLPAGPIRSGSGRFIWPVNGPITSQFCERRAWEACHPGIDIGVPSGTPIRAAGAGVVQIAGPNGGYGNYTCIGHGGGVSTCYAHQSQINVSVGQSVSQGQVIGISGCTGLCFGAHLHFEVRVNGSVTNPLNWL